MVTGRSPFESTNVKMMLIEITHSQLMYPVHLSEDCHDFIQQAIHPDPKLRPTSERRQARTAVLYT